MDRTRDTAASFRRRRPSPHYYGTAGCRHLLIVAERIRAVLNKRNAPTAAARLSGTNAGMDPTDPLDLFLPPVREWFRTALGEPTPPQRQGWPLIAAGQNTLILAPTGSGKTLAAFLACLDHLWRQEPRLPRGVRVLYVSPLKALNNDIHRNLQAPARRRRRDGPPHGLAAAGARSRRPHRRHADRPSAAPRPPAAARPHHHAGIAAPAADLARPRHAARRHPLHRRRDPRPLPQQARRLPGAAAGTAGRRCNAERFRPHRPVGDAAAARRSGPLPRRRDARRRRAARAAAGRPSSMPGCARTSTCASSAPSSSSGRCRRRSVWPSIYRLLGDQIREHRSTIVFANDRRSVERITAFLNEERANSPAPITAASSLEVRQQTEAALKEGRLPAVVATASLELGIDMGAVDLVCQVESPGNVARGAAARRPGGAPRRPAEQGPAHPEDAGRPARTGGAGPRDGRRPRRGDPRADQLPRRAGPAARRHGGDGRLDRAGPVSRWCGGRIPIAICRRRRSRRRWR